jgi:hypothetical protein
VCEPLEPHEIAYHDPCTSTGSLKVIETFDPTATSLALFAGVVVATLGAVSAKQSLNGDAVFRGTGVPAVKSAALLSVSTQPPLLRRPAVVFDSVGAVLPSEQLAAP